MILDIFQIHLNILCLIVFLLLLVHMDPSLTHDISEQEWLKNRHSLISLFTLPQRKARYHICVCVSGADVSKQSSLLSPSNKAHRGR